MILDKITKDTRIRVAKAKEKVSLAEMKEQALKLPVDAGFPFEEKLKEDTIQFICEVKKASPSKGIIAKEFDYLRIAKEYENAEATAISVLTEPHFFMGSDKYLQEIRQEVKTLLLRKDFTIDEYQIYEAKVLGADIILLICAILDEEQIKAYIAIADTLGLSAIVEVHNETEMRRAIAAKARIIGVNNRNLKDFTIDINNSLRLRKLAPKEIAFIAESGITSHADIQTLLEHKVNGVLIGETLMRSDDKKQMLNKLRGIENDEN